MISWIGFRQEPVFYDRHRRFSGTTKFPLRKTIRVGVDAITALSYKPLALASYAGFFFAILAVTSLVLSFISWLQGAAIAATLCVIAVGLLVGGVQLIVLGIYGEYLGRLHSQSTGRPLFIVDRIVRARDDRAKMKAGQGSREPQQTVA